MKKIFLMMCCFFVLGQGAMAQDKGAAEKMIRSTLDTALGVLQQNELTTEDKTERITQIVSPMFDFSLMAKLTLGKKHWPSLNEEERKTFTDLFIKKLKNSYISKIMLYKDEKLVYEPTVQKSNKILIPTYVLSGDKKISIAYKLYYSGTAKDWRIYDIEIQGVSIIQSYYSQFDDFLKTGTIDDLLTKLKAPEPADS